MIKLKYIYITKLKFYPFMLVSNWNILKPRLHAAISYEKVLQGMAHKVII